MSVNRASEVWKEIKPFAIRDMNRMLDNKAGDSGDDLYAIILYDESAQKIKYYSMSAVGLAGALAAASSGDIVWVPAGTIGNIGNNYLNWSFDSGFEDFIEYHEVTIGSGDPGTTEHFNDFGHDENGCIYVKIFPTPGSVSQRRNGIKKIFSGLTVNTGDTVSAWFYKESQTLAGDGEQVCLSVVDIHWIGGGVTRGESNHSVGAWTKLVLEIGAGDDGKIIDYLEIYGECNSQSIANWYIDDISIISSVDVSITVKAGVELVGLGKNSILSGSITNNGILTNIQVVGSISGSGISRLVPNPTVELFSNQIKSLVATGTAPISVESTTLATNLNADMVDGMHASELASEQLAVVVSSSKAITSATTEWYGRASVEVINGIVILVYKESSGHADNDGALHIRFSDDYGKTWSNEDKYLDDSSVTGFPMNPNGASTGEDAGEPWLMIAPNGDLLLHMWRVDYGVSANGTYQSRSTDGGKTWSTSAQIDWVGAAGDGLIFATDDHYVHNGIIYVGVRVYDNAGPSNCKTSFAKSEDSGASWSIVADISDYTNDTQEIGFEYVGNQTIVAVLRALNDTKTYTSKSTDMGATWSALVDVSATLPNSGRHRILTRAHLMGKEFWWNDHILIMVGFTQPTSGASTPRRNCIWVSLNSGETWSDPFYLDVETGDAGYGDIFYNQEENQFVIITYQGTTDIANIKQYNVTISGIGDPNYPVTMFNDDEGDPNNVDSDAASVGVSSYAARHDHQHQLGSHSHVMSDITDLSIPDISGTYTQFITVVSGGDFTFIKDSNGNPVTAQFELE